MDSLLLTILFSAFQLFLCSIDDAATFSFKLKTRLMMMMMMMTTTTTNLARKVLLLVALTITTTISKTRQAAVESGALLGELFVVPGSAAGLCAVANPSLTLTTNSKIRCAARCVTIDGCSRFNYKPETTTCELFQLAPTCYQSLLSCSTYQLKSVPSMPMSTIDVVGIPAENCSFPYTYQGALHYSCMQSASADCEWNCMAGNRQWQTCVRDIDFAVTYQTVNLSIPTFVDPTPVVSINNWIVIQQRVDGTVSFNRNWAEYKAGFGDIYTNFWLGLEKMHQLTLNRVVMLRIEIQATANGKWFSAEYATFRIDSESNDYAVYVTGYSGDAGDGFNPDVSISVQNGMKFSTLEVDNDLYNKNCIKNVLGGGGGFWMNSCSYFNLNEPYGSQYFYWHYLVDLKIATTQQISGSRMMAKYVS